MLKNVTDKMKKQVKEYDLVSADNLDNDCNIDFIKYPHLLPPCHVSNLDGKVIFKLAKFMEVCKASILNFSSSQRKYSSTNQIILQEQNMSSFSFHSL